MFCSSSSLTALRYNDISKNTYVNDSYQVLNANGISLYSLYSLFRGLQPCQIQHISCLIPIYQIPSPLIRKIRLPDHNNVRVRPLRRLGLDPSTRPGTKSIRCSPSPPPLPRKRNSISKRVTQRRNNGSRPRHNRLDRTPVITHPRYPRWRHPISPRPPRRPSSIRLQHHPRTPTQWAAGIVPQLRDRARLQVHNTGLESASIHVVIYKDRQRVTALLGRDLGA